MKKGIALLFTATTLAATAALPMTSVYAAESVSNESSQVLEQETQTEQQDPLNILDPFVKVIENKYVLELPEDVNFDAVLVQDALNTIEETNKVIDENNAIIDPETKTATFYESSIQTMAYKEGVNKVTVHWNYARIYLSKTNVKKIQGGSLGVLGFLVGKVPDVRVNLVGLALVGVIGSSEPKGGLWFDYNYLNGVLFGQNWGWQ